MFNGKKSYDINFTLIRIHNTKCYLDKCQMLIITLAQLNSTDSFLKTCPQFKNKNQRKFLVAFFIKKIDMLATAVLTR